MFSFLYSTVLPVSLFFCRNPLSPPCLTDNFTVSERSLHSFFKVCMLLQEMNISQSFLSCRTVLSKHSKCSDRKLRPREMRQLPGGRKDVLWHKPAVSALPLGYASSFHKTSFLQKVLIQSWISASFLKVILYSLQFCLLCSPLLLLFLTQPIEYFLSEVIIFH